MPNLTDSVGRSVPAACANARSVGNEKLLRLRGRLSQLEASQPRQCLHLEIGQEEHVVRRYTKVMCEHVAWPGFRSLKRRPEVFEKKYVFCCRCLLAMYASSLMWNCSGRLTASIQNLCGKLVSGVP